MFCKQIVHSPVVSLALALRNGMSSISAADRPGCFATPMALPNSISSSYDKTGSSGKASKDRGMSAWWRGGKGMPRDLLRCLLLVRLC